MPIFYVLNFLSSSLVWITRRFFDFSTLFSTKADFVDRVFFWQTGSVFVSVATHGGFTPILRFHEHY